MRSGSMAIKVKLKSLPQDLKEGKLNILFTDELPEWPFVNLMIIKLLIEGIQCQQSIKS